MPAETPDLGTFLRAETGAAHRSMEAALDLLGSGVDEARMRRILGRFLGFHAVWEPALRRWPSIGVFAEGRGRLPYLRRDLEALGMTPSAIDALPVCEAAAALADTEAGALGSVYVIEGSTLGGQVISRALADRGWLPPGGLTHFHPYGPRTGEMWRECRAWLEVHPAAARREVVARGARRTFALLEGWLTC